MQGEGVFEVSGRRGWCVAGLTHTLHPRERGSGGMVRVLRASFPLIVPVGPFKNAPPGALPTSISTQPPEGETRLQRLAGRRGRDRKKLGRHAFLSGLPCLWTWI